MVGRRRCHDQDSGGFLGRHAGGGVRATRDPAPSGSARRGGMVHAAGGQPSPEKRGREVGPERQEPGDGGLPGAAPERHSGGGGAGRRFPHSRHRARRARRRQVAQRAGRDGVRAALPGRPREPGGKPGGRHRGRPAGGGHRPQACRRVEGGPEADRRDGILGRGLPRGRSGDPLQARKPARFRHADLRRGAAGIPGTRRRASVVPGRRLRRPGDDDHLRDRSAGRLEEGKHSG